MKEVILLNRKEELEDIFKDIDANEKRLVNQLIDEVIFLEEQMIYLKTLPFIRVHEKDKAKQKTTPAAKLYKEHSQSYMNAIRILCALLHKVDTSAESELMKRLEGFRI
jgi:hypothetical protein